MKVLRIIAALAVWVVSLFGSAGMAQTLSENRPNIVILFSDDAGYADFGFQPCCSDEMKQLTPNIDRVAKEGVRMTNAYMSGCVCAPSRAGLMTGRYQQRFGFDNNLPPGFRGGLDLGEQLCSQRIKRLGYQTGLIGKWHLGYPPAYQPNSRGYDSFYGVLQGSRDYFPIDNPSPHRVILDNVTPTPESGYVTDRFGDAACKFIKSNVDRPFFLFVSFTSPHSPLQPKPEDLDRVAHIRSKRRAAYAGLIVSLDDNVGRILDCLDQTGLTDKTLVVFTNDNGGQTQSGAVNAPLRGRKGMLYEGGVRVPWAMRWPQNIPAGSVIDDPVIALDLLPTMIEVAGGKVDPQWDLDGISLRDRIVGNVDQIPDRPLYWRINGSTGNRAMREGDWKLYESRADNESPQLFQLSDDIGESNDVAQKYPDRVRSMQKSMDAWESGMVEPRWKFRRKRRR